MVASLDTLKIFEYNKTGKEILKLINNKRNTQEIIKTLENRWDCKKKEIEDYTIEFLNLLLKDKIISELK